MGLGRIGGGKAFQGPMQEVGGGTVSICGQQ